MKYRTRQLLYTCALMTLGIISGPAWADNTALPPWQVLEFEQQVLWATAKSRMEVVPAPQHENQWLLSATSSVMSKSEEVQLKVLADSGRLVTRSRLTSGKNQRLKTYAYRQDYVLRERREQGNDTQQAPKQWPLTSTREVPYPDGLGDTVLTDAYTLLVLAQRFANSQDTSRELAVHTDMNFYRVSLTRAQDKSAEANYQIAGKGRVEGKRNVRVVKVKATALGQPGEKADFRLLGLNGDIELLFDKEHHVLLQVRGNAPRIGATEISLKSAILRDPANE